MLHAVGGFGKRRHEKVRDGGLLKGNRQKTPQKVGENQKVFSKRKLAEEMTVSNQLSILDTIPIEKGDQGKGPRGKNKR